MKRVLVAWIATLALTGCGNDEPPPDIIKPQRDAMEKAKGVEQTLQQDAERTQREIDSQQ